MTAQLRDAAGLSLLPCPFCGSEAKPAKEFADDRCGCCILTYQIIRCDGCGARTSRCFTIEEAQAEWNSREDAMDNACDRHERNLNPHKAARMAMALYHDKYAAQMGGSMDFWDSLTEMEKGICRRALESILSAPDEG